MYMDLFFFENMKGLWLVTIEREGSGYGAIVASIGYSHMANGCKVSSSINVWLCKERLGGGWLVGGT